MKTVGCFGFEKHGDARQDWWRDVPLGIIVIDYRPGGF